MVDLPGLVLPELLQGMKELVPAVYSEDLVMSLLDEFTVKVMPVLTYQWHIHHGAALYCFVRLAKPHAVLETGVREGESTVSILSAMAVNGFGHLVSCDIDLPEGRTFRFLSTDLGRQVDASMELDSNHRALLQPFLRPSVFPKTGAEWSFFQRRGADLMADYPFPNQRPDVFFHDSDHSYENQKAEYDLAWWLVRPGGFVGGDDVEWDKPPWAFFQMAETHGQKPSIVGKGRMIRKPEA